MLLSTDGISISLHPRLCCRDDLSYTAADPRQLVTQNHSGIQIAINLLLNTKTDQNQFQEEYDWVKTWILQQELFDSKPLVILENKRDKRESASVEDKYITQALRLHEINQYAKFGQQGIHDQFCDNPWIWYDRSYPLHLSLGCLP